MLPMILGALGSGMASAGMLGALSPLMAGALGSGLGAYAQTGDLKSALGSGLGAYAGGSLFGGAGSAAGKSAIPSGTAAPMATPRPMLRGDVAASPGITGLFKSGMGTLGTGGMLGATLGGALFPPSAGGISQSSDTPERISREPYNRQMTPAPAGYRPGMDPEHNYFAPTYRPSGFANMVPTRRMAAGGLADIAQQMQGPSPAQAQASSAKNVIAQMSDMEIVRAATMAIKGLLTDKEAAMALGEFLNRNGEEKLQRLIKDVQDGKAEEFGRDDRGLISGPGNGTDDLVPAMMPETQEPVLLSDGEYVVPQEKVAAIGGGSVDKGADEIEKMTTRAAMA